MFTLPVPWPWTAYLLAGLLLATPLVMLVTRLSPTLAGWRWGGWTTPVLGLGWGGLLAVGAVAWMRLLLHDRYLPIESTVQPSDWLLLVLAVPVAEEIFFRGAIFGGLQRNWKPFWAVCLSATFYTFAHSTEPWLALQWLAAAGYALAFRQSGSVVTPILAHALVTAALLASRSAPAVVAEFSGQALLIAAGGCLALLLAAALGARKQAVVR